MLSELQTTLKQQAQTLVQRTRARQITGADPKFAQFAELMEKAAGFMDPAAEALAEFDLEDAVQPEQQALQFLLRAENLFTDIQLTMGRGGGQGGGLSRDLAEMFELEMDLEKNQYETGGGASGQQIEQELDEAMKKLEELARRQERLADRAQDRAQASFEQRWQQEMLRREAEDLRRQLEQLQRRQQAGSQQANSQQQSGSGSSSGRSGQRSGQMDRAIRQLERAEREMERGSRNGAQRDASANALRELREAVDQFAEQRRQETQAALSGMAQEAAELAAEQEQAAAELQKSLKVALEALKAQGGRQNGNLPTGMTREEEIDLADRKADMGDRLAEIEQGIQRQSRLLRGKSDEASRELMQALLDLQQSEAAPAIRYASEMIRRGLAPYVASNEEAVSRALRQLRDNLRNAGQAAEGSSPGRDRGLDGVLSDLERLRRSLEDAARPGEGDSQRSAQAGQQGRQGQSPGQGRGQQQGMNPGQPGQGAGGGRQGGQMRGGWAGGDSLGDGRWRGGIPQRAADPATRERMEQALESSLAEIPRLTRELRATEAFDPQDVFALRQFARELGDGRFSGNPILLEREYREMMALLEQLEVQIRRQVELDDKDEVRAVVAETVPESYREAVAEYYRKLGAGR